MRLTRNTKLVTTLALTPAAILAAASAFASGHTPNAQRPTPSQVAFFESKVRPVLIENCLMCHGANEQKSGLRLDSREAALKGGARGPAIVSGDPDASLVMQAVRRTGALKMPPGGALRPNDAEALAEWIKTGAVWPSPPNPLSQEQERGSNGSPRATVSPSPVLGGRSRGLGASFWSFQPVRLPPVPVIRNPQSPIRNPIDAFLLARLNAAGLKPAPPADRRTLVRRAYFDLLGLPPTPREVAEFLADSSPNAWEKLIDRLLANPHYGERWGRHWLDVARYADSNGLDENKAFANAYHYRDYVVNALNADKPYDQFIKEQIAGDLLLSEPSTIKSQPSNRNDCLTATGFLCLGAKVLAEQDKPKLVMDIVDEQIDVMSKAIMGLTVSCARCHDHKFDPIPTADYYALAGIFKSTKTMADLGFVSNWNERPLVTAELEEQIRHHKQQVDELKAKAALAARDADAEVRREIQLHSADYLAAGREIARSPGVISVADLPPQPGVARIIVEAENFTRAKGVVKDFQTYGKGIGVIHNVGLPDEIEWDVQAPSAGDYQVELRYASAEKRPVQLFLNGQPVRASVAGQVTGSFQPEGQKWEVAGVFAFAAGKNTLRIERTDGPIPHFDKLLIVAVPPLAPGAPARPRSLEQVASERHIRSEVARLAATLLAGPGATLDAAKLAARLAEETAKQPEPYRAGESLKRVKEAEEAVRKAEADAPKPPMAMAVDEGQPADCRIHIRGNTLTLGDEVPRRFLGALCGGTPQPVADRKHSGRLELAEWLVSPTHPLTSRVMVNRVWQHHFGEGIVRTPDNWGALGERPTHPQLLDWLASEFMSSCNWSVKKLHRLIMTSQVYRMSSMPSAEAEENDPENRLLSHFNRRRLEAEPIRDALLAVAGRLDLTIGGSLLTSKNNDYVTNDQSGNAGRYTSTRRAIYMPVIRNALYDMFQAFDFGDPTMVNAKRATTTVAPQALFLMNSPFVLEQSKAFAALVLAQQGSDTERLRIAYNRAYARPPTTVEAARDLAFLVRMEAAAQGAEKDPAKRRELAWQALCHALLASNEFVYVD